MYLLQNGGIVIDNPGTRKVGIVNSDTGIKYVFGEIGKLANQCKYSNCTHIHEPGCAILEAIENKIINKEKYKNYLKLKKESDYYKLTAIEKKKKDRKFGQFIKKALDELKDI